MFLMFSLQTLDHIKASLRKKGLKICEATIAGVTFLILKWPSAVKKPAFRVEVLLGPMLLPLRLLMLLELISGFVMGGFAMKHLMTKPI